MANRSKKIGSVLLSLALLLSLLPSAVLTPASAEGVYTYEEATWNGRGIGSEVVYTTRTAEAVQVDSGTTSWTTGWYAVTADTTIGPRISVSGDVHLILCDGCTLTASQPGHC